MTDLILSLGSEAELVVTVPDGTPVRVHYPRPSSSEDILFQIRNAIATLTTKVENMDQALQTAIDALRADVTAQTTADASVKALIVGMSQQLTDALAKAAAAGASPEQLQALTDLHAQLAANTADLTTAVTANTPAALPTTPVPVEVPPVAVPVPVEVPPAASVPVATDPAAPAVPAVDPATGLPVPPAAG